MKRAKRISIKALSNKELGKVTGGKDDTDIIVIPGACTWDSVNRCEATLIISNPAMDFLVIHDGKPIPL